MKKIFLVLFLFLNFSLFASGEGNDYTFPVALISAAQDITSVWTDVGSPIEVTGYKKLVLDGDLDINGAINARLRVVRQATSGGTDRIHMIKTVEHDSVGLEDDFYEFIDDDDQNFSVDFDIFPVNYVQVQTQVGTESTTNAQLDAVNYFLLKE